MSSHDRLASDRGNDNQIELGLEFADGSLDGIKAFIPQTQNVFEIFFDIQSNQWQNWKSVFLYAHEDVSRLRSPYCNNIMVTQDALRTSFLIRNLNRIKKHILLIGFTATGKTAILRNFINGNEEPTKNAGFEYTSFSSAVNSERFRDIVEKHLKWVGKNTYGPMH